MKYDLSNNIERHRANEYFQKLIKQEANIELKIVREKRSIKQNAYMHVLFSIFGNEFGLHLHESKEIVKRQLGYTYKKKSHEFLMQTSKMDSKQLTQFIDLFRKWSLEVCEFYLPTVEEYKENKNNIDNELENYS